MSVSNAVSTANEPQRQDEVNPSGRTTTISVSNTVSTASEPQGHDDDDHLMIVVVPWPVLRVWGFGKSISPVDRTKMIGVSADESLKEDARSKGGTSM